MEPKDFDTILNKYIEDITETRKPVMGSLEVTQVHPHMNSREQFLHAWYSVKLSCPRISIIARYPENKNTKY